MCRNDKKLLKYVLSIDLYDEVQPFTLDEEVVKNQSRLLSEYEESLKQF